MAVLQQAMLAEGELEQLVREFSSPRYKEGYEKGIHDFDACLLLRSLLPALESADLLRFDPSSRALAQVFWVNIKSRSQNTDSAALSYISWPERAQSAAQMQSTFHSKQAIELLAAEVASALTEFIEQHPIGVDKLTIRRAADYLVAELGRERLEFIGSKYAVTLVEELKRSINDETWRHYQLALEKMLGWPAERWNLSSAWLQAMIQDKQLHHLQRYIPEAVALINADQRLERRWTEVDLELRVESLMGDHPNIIERCLNFGLDEFLLRLQKHRDEVVPAYHRYLAIRQEVISSERDNLRLQEFKARPLSSFVRNRLINESYLPLIGDNLAKQMGTVGDNKRTDLMGLLMMISPPGYGKTTLMEYVANRLGLIFMKINCPSLGHQVVSLDPEQAPNATARKELQKLNLGLEMGNNVMLYLDDIQHTDPEFLQKFISLCDGTRRIDGVWRGNTKTYDMRGRKF
ncbi:MAG: AAA family ATPase, partial [Cellvibrionaceae bacterium]|nr:AAA family ATPase [Cellvibrionaceae bacterium]